MMDGNTLSGAERAFPDRARHVEELSPSARAWLSSILADDEELLAWLEGDCEPPNADTPGASLHFLHTTRRTGLAILAPSGDGELRPLPDALVVEQASDGWFASARRDVCSGHELWTTTRSNAALYQELAPIVGLPVAARLLELARWNFKQGDAAYAASLLAEAMAPAESHSADVSGEAVEILEDWLEAHPSVEVRAVLPHTDGALPPELSLRLRALELLEQATVRQTGSNATVLPRTAQLQPLDRDFLAPLADRASGRARELLEAVLGLFEPGSLAAGDEPAEPEPDAAPEALGKELVEATLQHAAAREGNTWGRLQAMLAKADAPDYGVLRSFCERLRELSSVLRAAGDASRVLETAVPEIFISRGEKAVGLRAFESTPPFLLIGNEHLDAGSPFYLRPAEMRFGIASELAHLRYRHTRATAAQVRAGALDKSLAAVGFAVSLVPLVASAGKLAAGSRLVGKLTSLFKSVPKSALDKVSENTGLDKKLKSGGSAGRRRADFLSMADDELIEAHRVMQLTADRAGLLMCGDLVAAIRCMFLTCPAYATEIELLERVGLPAVLDKRTESGALLHEELVLRIGHLLAFYLSEDYRILRTAAGFELG